MTTTTETTATEPDEVTAAGYDPEAIAREVAAWVQARQGQA